MQLGDADALANQSLAAHALQLAHGRPEIGDDRGLRRRSGRGTPLAYGSCTSCHPNYHNSANNPVNMDHPSQREDQMRFALMIESQQGLSYGDHVAIAKRAEANGIETLFRSDHYQSFPGPAGNPTTDAWTILAGLARETDRTRSRCPRVACHVPSSGQLRQGRHDRGRDERRTDRSRRRRGLERARAPAARPAFSGDQGTRRSHGGPASDPPRTMGRAGRLVVRRPPGDDQRRAVLPEAGRRSRPSADTDRRRATRAWLSVVRARRAHTGSRPATPTSSTSVRRGRTEARQAFAEVDAACEAIGRDPSTLTHSTMAGVLIGRDEAEMAERLAASVAAFGEGEDEGAWLEERLERWITGTPEQARETVTPLRGRGRRADHAPGPPALGPRHDRRHGRGPDRPGLEGAPGRGRPASVAGGLRRGQVDRVVAPDRVGVRARARANRSVRSWSGVARPEQRRHRSGQVGCLADDEPAGRGQRRVELRAPTSADRIAAARRPMTRAAARAWRARARRSARRSRSVEDQDEPGGGSCRRQVAVQERLEVAVRGRAARRPLRP